MRDITANNARIEDIALRVGAAGTFQEFNEAIAPLGRIWYYDGSTPRWLAKPFDISKPMSNGHFGLRDILARMPGLSEKYSHTFGTEAKSISVTLNVSSQNPGSCDLRIDDPILFENRGDLVRILSKLRTTYPFLTKWHFVDASHAWGYSILNFNNAQIESETTLEEDLIEGVSRSYVHRNFNMPIEPPIFTPASEILPALSGGYTHSGLVCAMEPIAGVNLNEHALQFLGSFLLSSLVRYRPLAWQAAISRSVSAEVAADDRALALIEEFLERILSDFPTMVVRTIDYLRTR